MTQVIDLSGPVSIGTSFADINGLNSTAVVNPKAMILAYTAGTLDNPTGSSIDVTIQMTVGATTIGSAIVSVPASGTAAWSVFGAINITTASSPTIKVQGQATATGVNATSGNFGFTVHTP